MNKEKILTRRMNTNISLVQGLPTFAFIGYALATPLGQTKTGMILISVLGGLFCLILEYHTSLRFAWLLETSGAEKSKPSTINAMLLAIHNIIYWFFIIPFVTPMPYGTGFLIYAIILFIRFVGNTIINVRNFTPEQYYKYPFRIP